MKIIKPFEQFINEELNILRGYTDKETYDELDKLSPNEAFRVSYQNDFIPGIKRAIERGADVNAKCSGGEIALTYLTMKGKLDIVKYLVENGADVNVKNNGGMTALNYASCYGKLDIVKYLVENGADVNVKNNGGMTALMWASEYGDLDIVQYLIENGANVNILDDLIGMLLYLHHAINIPI
ncbi:MAG: ankyrin repeat domain-containing protein [Bacteroidales bacterium]|nr:ankyrin repeat domain-containing protein [Bacteroidales bacterium]